MYTLVLAFVTAFMLTYSIIPVIIRVAKELRLFDHPNDRSSHVTPTPSLGGVAIFAGTVCGIVLWTPLPAFGPLQYILAAFIIIFLLGVLDDLTPVSPVKKFVGQLMVAVILAYKADVQITSFYGVLGVQELPMMVRFALSVTIIIGIINAFNLIDGINGLAGSIGLLACFSFGVWFFSVGMISLAVSAIALAGSIIAFLKYNLAPCRIFMGDTGSLLIGTMCSVLAIEFVEANYQTALSNPFRLASAPSIALAILILPIFDTCSVFARRMMRGNSPFTADKTHIHHQMLAITGSHARATSLLLLFNVLFVVLAFSIRDLGTQQSLPILLIVVSVCGFILYRMYSAKTASKGG